MGNVTRLADHQQLPKAMTADDVTKLVKELLAEGGRLEVSTHAYRRMEERDISMRQIMHVLQRGDVTDGPFQTEHRNWKFTMQADTSGQLVSVAAAFEKGLMGHIVLVITVF